MKIYLLSILILAKRSDDCPPLLCFFGKSTEKEWQISLADPVNLANMAPLPSTTINPKLYSHSNKDFNS